MEKLNFSDDFLNFEFLNKEPKLAPSSGFRMFKVNGMIPEMKIYSNAILPENSAMLSPDLYDKILKYFEDKCKDDNI